MNPIPPVTKYLLWALGIAFLLQQLQPQTATIYFALWPWGEFQDSGQVYNLFQPWQLLTYGLLHGSFMHLFLNAFGLIQFAPRIEYALGQKRFIIFCLVCTIGAGLCQLAIGTWQLNNGGNPYPTVGASGLIYGVLLAYGMLYPHERIMMLLPPIEMSARTFVMVFGGIELFFGVTGTMAGVAHFAHLGGMLFGWLLLRWWQNKPPFNRTPRPPPPPKRPNHLRSIN